MVIVTEFNCTVQTYRARFAQLVFPRPTTCPHCQTNHSFVGHGFYPRKPLDAQQVYGIRIKRWYCTVCQRTLSLLPSFLLCFRHYLLEVIQSVVVARYDEAASWRQVAKRCGANGAPASRTMKRWCQALAAQAATWLGEMEQTLAHHDPALPVLDALGQHAGPLDPPRALLAASVQLLAWAKTRWRELAASGLRDRLRFLWHWGHARGLARLV
jgi:transposase-like protein